MVGEALHPRRHGRRRRGRPVAPHARHRGAGAACGRGGRPRPLRRGHARRRDSGRRGDRRRSSAGRTSRSSSSRTRSTTRRTTPPRTSSTGSASAIPSRSPPCTATEPETSSTRSWRRFRAKGREEVGEDAIGVAILGRPNVGKSSLLNALVGEERVIVSGEPGTTRDTVDTVLERGERTFVLVDTAGMRRKRRQRQGVEYYSELRAIRAAERADVALVLVDSSEGVVEQDLAVADVARTAGCSTLVVLSKWDIAEVGIEDVRERLGSRLRQRPTMAAVSSKTGRGVGKLLDRVEAALRHAHEPDRHRGAQPLPRRAARAAARAREGQPAAEPPLRHPGLDPPAALSLLRQRSRSLDARLRLLGREPPPRALRPRGRARDHRLRAARMKVAVVGAGSWGAAFAGAHGGARARGHARRPGRARTTGGGGRGARLRRRPEPRLPGGDRVAAGERAGHHPHRRASIPRPASACRRSSKDARRSRSPGRTTPRRSRRACPPRRCWRARTRSSPASSSTRSTRSAFACT